MVISNILFSFEYTHPGFAQTVPIGLTRDSVKSWISGKWKKLRVIKNVGDTTRRIMAKIRQRVLLIVANVKRSSILFVKKSNQHVECS